MKKFGLSILSLLSVAAIAGGCNNQADEPTRTGASMSALTATVDGETYCVQGTIRIYSDDNNNGVIDSGDNLVSTVDTDCGDPSHEVILLPDDYLLEILPTGGNPLCTSTLVGYVSCELNPDPTAFSVNVNLVTPVPVGMIFHYENDFDQNILFSVGGANVTLDPPENQERCGEGVDAPVCTVDQVCACYDNCSTNLGSGGAGGAPAALTCGADETCTATGVTNVDQRATNPAALPPPLVIGEEGALADTLWLCVPDAAAGGAGGSAGSTP